MTIDERIEALTQSVELLATMHRDNEKRMDQMAQAVMRIGQAQGQLEQIVAQIADGTSALMQIAHDHEERIVALEEK